MLTQLMGETWGEFGHPAIVIWFPRKCLSEPATGVEVASPFNAVVHEKSDDKAVDRNQTCARFRFDGIGHGGFRTPI